MATERKTSIALLIRIVAFACLVIGSILVLTECIGPTVADPDDLMTALTDKERMLAQTPSRRIILIGGSNNLFGIDSAELQKTTGYNVINASLHAGLGLEFYLYFVSTHLRNDDIVLLCPEFYLAEGEMRLIAHTAHCYPKMHDFIRHHYSTTDQARLFILSAQTAVSGSFLFLKSKLRPDSEFSLYRRSNLNAHGDMIGHLSRPPKSFVSKPPNFPGKENYLPYISAMNAFASEAKRVGAQVIFSYPTFRNSEYQMGRMDIENLHALLKLHLQMPILAEPDFLKFPDEWYDDTPYHLTGHGRSVRTSLLSELLLESGLLKPRKASQQR